MALKFLVFLLVFGMFGFADAADRGLPFYKGGLDRTVKSKEQYIEKIEKNQLVVTRAQLAERINRTRGTSLGGKDVVSFVRRPNITVEGCKPGEKISSDYYMPRSKEFAQFVRPCYDGEPFLAENGEKFLSLMCGNTCVAEPLSPIVVIPPPRRVEPRVGSPWRQKPEKQEAVAVMAKKECQWVSESNPSPPIAVGGSFGVWNGSGVSFGSGMSIGASHRQRSCQ